MLEPLVQRCMVSVIIYGGLAVGMAFLASQLGGHVLQVK